MEEIKQVRIKERTIQDVTKMLCLWRALYAGHFKGHQFRKLSLEEAATKVKISKKSLDDYLMQFRNARKFGFDFAKHNNKKVGVIRSFVKKMKDLEKTKQRN